MAALRFGRWQQEGGTVLARILAAALFTLIPSIAFGQCSGNFPANTLCGTATGGVPHAVAAPLSVANSDSTLTIAPTTGSVIASLNLGHSNSWSATQTFPNVIDTNLVSGGTQCVQATAAGLLVGTGAVCGSGGGGGGVTSVNNSDGTLAVVAPTGPAVTVSLALSHANTWTATQIFPSNSLTNAELAQMPADTVKCNNTGSLANVADCTSITIANLNFVTAANNGINDQTAVSGNKNTFWTNLGAAVIHRMNRLMVGTNSTAGSGTPPSPADWLESLVNCTTQCGQISSLSVLGTMGLTGGARTSDSDVVFGGVSGGSAGAYLFGVNDDTAQQSGIALGSNSVGMAKAANKGITLGAQQDVDSAVALGCIPNPATTECPAGASSIGNLITAGAFGSIATQNVGTGLVIGPGATAKWEKGIIVVYNGLDAAQGQGGAGVAMELYPGHTLRWYDGTTVWAEMGAVSAGGVFNMFTQGGSAQWKMNGVTTVSCASGTVNGATVVVTNGIITHC
jgi:hypothetical protein